MWKGKDQTTIYSNFSQIHRGPKNGQTVTRPLRMVNLDNFGGLTSVLKFHIFLNFNWEELVRIRVICEGLVQFFSDVKNWYSIFTNVKNWYQFFKTQKV